jgi:hypothetical protein
VRGLLGVFFEQNNERRVLFSGTLHCVMWYMSQKTVFINIIVRTSHLAAMNFRVPQIATLFLDQLNCTGL